MFKKLITLAATVAGAGALAVGGAAVASAAPVPHASVTAVCSPVHVDPGTTADLNLTFTNHLGVVDFDATGTSVTPTSNLVYSLTGAAGLHVDSHGTVTPGTAATGTEHGVVVKAVTFHGSAQQQTAARVCDFRVVNPRPVNHVPYVYDGHVLTVSAHSATVGWRDSPLGWPTVTNGVIGNHCVEVFMYGFDKPAGQAHIGFTCDNGNPAGNVGYLRDLAAGHSVALFVQPAEGTYMNHHVIPGTSPKAHIEVVTPAV